VTLAAVSLSAGLCLAAETDGLVRAELLSKVRVASRQEPLMVGVRLRIAPGWHVYWQNPGDSGQATEIRLTLPPGFREPTIMYPVPVKFLQPGPVIGYGYETDVVFPVRLEPEGTFVGDSLRIEAEVNWLVCKDQCIPGRANLTLELPVRDGQAEPGELWQDFVEWTDRVPKALSPSIQLDQSADGSMGRFTVELPWDFRKVELFPPVSDAIEFPTISVERKGRKVEGSFEYRALQGKATAGQTVEWVLGYEDENGKQRGLRLPVVLPAVPMGSR
jgi:DsbC/DsbD-like thiol-disulfide interchange protein